MRNFFPTLFLCSLATVASAEPADLFSATLRDLNNKPVALSQYKGKPLIVNFWARWCAPCREEIPEFIRLREVHRDKLEILGIGIEDDPAAVKEFALKYKISYPVFVAQEQGIPLMRSLENTRGGLPFTVVIDRRGKVVQTKLGLMRKADLDKAAALALQ